MMAAVICLTAVFVFNATAQSFQNTKGETPVVKDVTPANLDKKTEKESMINDKAGNSQIETKKVSEPLIYENYKGSKDINVAKDEWIKDNPEQYEQLKKSEYSQSKKQQPSQVVADQKAAQLKLTPEQKTNTPAKTSVNKKGTSNTGKLPNADKRLPAKYDDSKTNNTSKLK